MRTTRLMKSLGLGMVLIFATTLFHLPLVLASPTTSPSVEMEITVKVNQKGFLDQKGKLYTKKNILQLPKNKAVRIKFVFDESLTSLAYGDTHQVAITGKNGTQESEKIWAWNQLASIVLHVGEEGAQYRAYCILDCIGMEHLNNLVIHSV